MTPAPIMMEKISPPADHYGMRLDCHLNVNSMTQARKEVELLRQLNINGPMTMKQMIEATGYSESAAGRALKSLERHCLVAVEATGKIFHWRLRRAR